LDIIHSLEWINLSLDCDVVQYSPLVLLGLDKLIMIGSDG